MKLFFSFVIISSKDLDNVPSGEHIELTSKRKKKSQILINSLRRREKGQMRILKKGEG
jgi:hypothetical protein